ncbi:hypothetical protein LMG27177_07574 [Paraburkholderia fynbosensis]|uniref:Uncharacterized protein n=1 Tax=Paraburkholderia fynbosensis TaxID=1200993 RepID=A0A6J5H5Q1_9BURK|nr:hypothetical protein LMG27177_07574 [Paraburkholderia fynbosensis]
MILCKTIAPGVLLLSSLALSGCSATLSDPQAARRASSLPASSTGASDNGSWPDRYTDETERQELAILRYVRGS